MVRFRSTPEFNLAAACCQWPPSPARDAQVLAAASGVDWSAFLRLVARHRIEGLVHAALTSAKAPMGVAARSALSQAAGRIVRESLLLAAETVRLQTAFDEAGLANLVLKGPAVEMIAYGRLGLKRAWDIDLLVLPEAAAAARALLEARGYELADQKLWSAAAFDQWTGLCKECLFFHRESGQAVELHWSAVDGALLPGLSATSPSQTVSVAPGLSLRTFAREELFAYLVVHGASHAWARLKFLADLEALLSGEDDIALERLHARAAELGAGVCPEVAARLRRRLFGSPAPRSIASAPGQAMTVRWLEALALDAMCGAGDREVHERRLASERIRLSQILFDRRWTYRLGEFRRQWLSVHDRRQIRLPARLAFLYDMLRVPLWLWRQIHADARPYRAQN